MNKKIDYSKLPEHIAIILDGNGRWAKKRLLTRKAGHAAGAQTLRTLTEKMNGLGFKYLTVYAFSTENWSRPEEEVTGLMNLLRDYIRQYIEDSKKNNVKINVIGDLSKLDADLRESVKYLLALTKNNDGLQMTIALNYGGRDEITRMARKIGYAVLDNQVRPENITEKTVEDFLDTHNLPEVDMLIRTSGEMRISNFLLWQIAYCEFFFVEKLWPDFNINDLLDCVHDFQSRDRRFGGV